MDYQRGSSSGANPIGAENRSTPESLEKLGGETCKRNLKSERGVSCGNPPTVKSAFGITIMESSSERERKQERKMMKEEKSPHFTYLKVLFCKHGIQPPVRDCYTSSRYPGDPIPIIIVDCQEVVEMAPRLLFCDCRSLV